MATSGTVGWGTEAHDGVLKKPGGGGVKCAWPPHPMVVGVGPDGAEKLADGWSVGT